MQLQESLQVVNHNPYARLNGAWDRRIPLAEAKKLWREISSGSFLSPPGSNTKLSKGAKRGWSTVGLSLAPADMSGISVCSHCTPECKAACIGHSAGNAKYPAVVQARINRTQFLFRHPEAAMTILETELARISTGKRDALRLNTFSDIVWEALNPGLLEYASALGYRLYDYTKIPARLLRPFIPARLLRPFKGYDLTLSYSGHNWSSCSSVLAAGGRVSVVFSGWFPKEYAGYRVIDGDANDLRFLDPPNCIVGLHLKGVSPDRAGVFAVRKEQVLAC